MQLLASEGHYISDISLAIDDLIEAAYPKTHAFPKLYSTNDLEALRKTLT